MKEDCQNAMLRIFSDTDVVTHIIIAECKLNLRIE